MSGKNEKVLVLGGNGRVSRAAAMGFHKAGYQVTLVTRNGMATGNLPPEIDLVACDAMNEEDVINVCRHADLVFNGLNPKYTDWDRYALPMARNVITACKAAGAVHLFPGNVYNYGSHIPALVKSYTFKNPDTRKGRIREQMELLFKGEAEQNGLQTIILRAGDYFGGTMTGAWFDEAISANLQKRFMRYPGDMHTPHAWAYLPDLAETFVSLADKRQELGSFEEFLFPGHTLTGAELKKGLEQVLSTDLKSGTLPWWLIRIMGLVAPMMREISEISYLWFKPHQLDGTKLEKAIGTIPHTELEIALKTSLVDLGKLPLEERSSSELQSIIA